MRKGARIGSALMLTGAVLAGSACSQGKETTKPPTAEALARTKAERSARKAIKVANLYLRGNGGELSAILDHDDGPGHRGGVFGNQNICSATYDNKAKSIDHDLGREVDVLYNQAGGKESLAVQVAKEGEGLVNIIVTRDTKTCDLPTTPAQLEERMVELTNDPSSRIGAFGATGDPVIEFDTTDIAPVTETIERMVAE